MQQDAPVVCRRCEAEEAPKGRQKVSSDMFPCCGAACSGEGGQVLHSELDFLEADLVAAIAAQVSAWCAR